MSTLELKTQFHKLIDDLKDEQALIMFYSVMSDYLSDSDQKDILNDLTPAQLEGLKHARQQVAEGNTIPHDQAIKQIKQWRIK
jgi:hypothetical protein